MFIQIIEQKAGIIFEKIGVPQPEDIIRATLRDTIKNLNEVHDDVLCVFEEAAEDMIEQEGGDARRALCKTLALLSGHHK